MILTLDTTTREETIFSLIDLDEKIKKIPTENKSENLLPDLNNFLQGNKCELKDITTILVNIGPGSYTGTRIGVTVANTLAWSLNIPVLSFTSENRSRVKAAAKNMSGVFESVVLPLYSDKN